MSVTSADLPLPDSRPLLEFVLRHIDRCVNAVDEHLAVAERRKLRFAATIDRCQRGIQNHIWDLQPMPEYEKWQCLYLPDEALMYVPMVEFGHDTATQKLRTVEAKLEGLVGKEEYTFDEVVRYQECEAERIQHTREALLPYRMLRFRILEKLGIVPQESIGAHQAQGEAIDRRMASLVAQLGVRDLTSKSSPSIGHAAPQEVVKPAAAQYVTLDQAATYIRYHKDTVARWLREDKDAPLSAVEGGGGRRSEFDWASLRPFLEKKTGRKLEEQFPGQDWAKHD